MYHAAEVDPCAPGKYDPSKKKPKQRNLIECCGYHHEAKYNRRDWNVFLDVPARRRRPDSPVYALSRPSQCSPRFFAGVENSILQLDVVSIMDQYPDPLFKHGPAKRNDRGDVPRKWDPYGDAIPMPMYEHTFGAVNLSKQKAEVEYAEPSIDPGLDERWSTSPQDFMRRGIDSSRTLF